MVNSFLTSLSAFFEKFPSKRFFIAVSGGQDSMLLLDTCRRLNLPIKVLHVNYHLRGKESEEDQKFVTDYCIKHDIPFDVLQSNINETLKSGGNLQQLARSERYAFFQKHLTQESNSYVLVAHHQDDQMETFWLQLYRGAGMSGLQGMKSQNGRVLRPFLSITKKEIQAISKDLNLIWREDASNQSTKYLRNLFRLKLLPELEQQIDTLRNSVQLMQGLFHETLRANESSIQTLFDTVTSRQSIHLYELILMPDFKLIELFKLLHIPLNYVSKIKSLGTSEVGKRYDWNPQEGPFQSMIKEREEIRFIPSEKNAENIPTFHINYLNELPSIFDKSSLYLDHSKLKGNLFIRPWQDGDRMQPIGLKGSKLISDILKDDKVPNSDKKNCFVLSDEEKIISCIGHRIDRRSIANEQSKLIIRIDIQQ
ncbi:MAG: tRNA lysidine(34) synthetase TilS [Flavobacteriales bacterium]